MIIIILITLLDFLAFSGLSLNWSTLPYDEWRLIQWLIFAGTIPLLFFQKQYYSIKTLQIGLILLFFMVVSIYYSPYPQRTLADGCIYLLLYYLGLALIAIFKQNQQRRDIFFLLLALFPLLTALWLPIDIIISSLNQLEPTNAWHGAFLNIRYYNDALLPSLFLLWAHPACLKKYPKLVLCISIIYLWSIWTDGARAVMLAIIIGLILTAFLQRENKIQLKIPLLSLVLSYLLYQLMFYLGYAVIDITRTSSSGRSEIWQHYFSRFLEQALWGIGANNTEGIRHLGGSIVMHPHNIVLQWLTEWGIAGIFALCLLLLLAFKVIKYRQHLPFFALAGSIAIMINALLSGSMIYPLSQILNVLILAWVISYFPTPLATIKTFVWQKTYLYALLFFALLLSIHYQDIFQYKGSSESENSSVAPRIWQYGQSEHLNHADDILE